MSSPDTTSERTRDLKRGIVMIQCAGKKHVHDEQGYVVSPDRLVRICRKTSGRLI
jgi:hypothetical protein